MSENPHPTAGNAAEEIVASGDEGARERRLLLRDAVIAGLALLVLVLALALYFTVTSQKGTDGADGVKEVSAAAWIKQEAKSPPEEHSDRGGENEKVESVGQHAAGTYAPKPEDLSPPDLGGAEGDAIRHGTVQSGVPVITSLQRLGLTVQQAHAIITALKGIFDFRKARPGHAFELRVDEAGEPAHFLYKASLTEVYEVNRLRGSLKGRKKHIPTKMTEKRFGGTIASSLYKSLKDLGAHPSLAGRIVEVLANEVDFYKEQRPGDTFRVIVSEESLNGEFLGYGPVTALEYRGVKSGKKRFFRFKTSEKARAVYYSSKGISQPRSVISIPLHYTRLSSRFGMRYHPVLKRKRLHNGVDFSAPPGTPVWACREGTVTTAARKGANGNLVIIKHDENLQSFYAHLQRFERGIKRGVKVRERQVVGYVGSTGRSTGPHLHFGLKKGSRFIDPLKYKVQPGRPIASKYRKKLRKFIRTTGTTLDGVPIKPPSEPLAEHKEADEDVLGVEDW
jgi:murein DD-endopeptidase MepM/ murein hydrolase activator NlpD